MPKVMTVLPIVPVVALWRVSLRSVAAPLGGRRRRPRSRNVPRARSGRPVALSGAGRRQVRVWREFVLERNAACAAGARFLCGLTKLFWGARLVARPVLAALGNTRSVSKGSALLAGARG